MGVAIGIYAIKLLNLKLIILAANLKMVEDNHNFSNMNNLCRENFRVKAVYVRLVDS